MAVSTYVKDGKTFWKVYVNVRSKKDPSLRAQKVVKGLESEKAALSEEKKLLRELMESIHSVAVLGHTWDKVIGRWELAMRSGGYHVDYSPDTISDHVSCLRRWTASWLDRPAFEINKGDARQVFNEMEQAGKSRGFQKHVKYTINVVFAWGIEQRLILGVHESPVQGLKLSSPKEEKVPDILTIDEIRKLLLEAKRCEHPWYPIWVMALLTGMRNGELHALLWTDVELENRKILVTKSYHSKRKVVKTTKSGNWRTVPISDELFQLLSELKAKSQNREHVLPRFWKWNNGVQAEVLRAFCIGIGIRSIRFHALRACFATQLLANDIAPARVMKICGWAELKTMQRYIRMAGIDERGATQVLRVLPSDEAVMGEVVNLFEYKAKSE
jgi:integrase